MRCRTRVRALTFFDGFRGEDGRAWLLTIVRNTCYDWLRKSRRATLLMGAPDEIDTAPDLAPGPEAEQLRKADGRMLQEGLSALPAEYREVLVLRELEGMSYRQIAQVTAGADRNRYVAPGAGAQTAGNAIEGEDQWIAVKQRDCWALYLDDELDLARSLELETHVGSCAACALAMQRQGALKAALAQAPYFTAPESLRRRVTARPANVYRWIALAAGIAAMALALWRVGAGGPSPLDREIVAAHLRIAAGRPLDGRGVYRSAYGKALVRRKTGFLRRRCRILPSVASRWWAAAWTTLDNRTVAALVYKRRQHTVNVLTLARRKRAIVRRGRNGFKGSNWWNGRAMAWSGAPFPTRALRTWKN